MSEAQVLDVTTGTAAVRAVFTTRRGGVSRAPFDAMNLSPSTGDDAHRVRTNREALARDLGFDAGRAVVLEQVHGADVMTVGPGGGDGSYTGSLEGVRAADAAITAEAGVALFAMGADCPGVLLWDRAGACVGAAHAGWRGLVAGVIESAVQAMPVAAGGLRAVVGPAVGACCYPVDDALRATMAGRFGDHVVVGEAVDLTAAAVAALGAAGLDDDAVSVVGTCTSCDAERFYSYRRDGAMTGRQAGIIWRVEDSA